MSDSQDEGGGRIRPSIAWERTPQLFYTLDDCPVRDSARLEKARVVKQRGCSESRRSHVYDGSAVGVFI